MTFISSCGLDHHQLHEFLSETETEHLVLSHTTLMI